VINKLMTFEKKIIRKKNNCVYWRIKTNPEINYIKKQRLNWLGHVERMTEDNTMQKIKRWKPMSKRPIGRPKMRWEDDILEDIRSMDVRNWKKLAHNRDS
jgi:hypothetical protein